MSGSLFSPRATEELLAALTWIAEESPASADALLLAAIAAAKRIRTNPGLPRVQLPLAPAGFRFWSLRGFPYRLVLDATHDPPVVARFVHQLRDLSVVLADGLD